MTDGRFIRGIANGVKVKLKDAERHERDGRLNELVETYPPKTYERIIRLIEDINSLLEEENLIVEEFNSRRNMIKIRRID